MKFKNPKLKILMLSLTAIIALSAVCGTAAYFTAEDTARNAITTGNIKIEIQEKMLSPDGSEKLVPFEDTVGVMPGCTASKIVCVENTGGQDAYIRVSVDKAIKLAEGVVGETDSSLVSFELNEDFWSLDSGFYYYNRVLPAGELSEPLFTELSFSGKMGNTYQSSKAIITVNAYATQAANNGENALNAAGWPEIAPPADIDGE